ncbi:MULTISPECIES: HD domain-containing protein [Kocuria]|uniref:HD domain-containing protein n=1 Tax=Kocuria TaxID=57493 RepID=UPI002273A297|nr:HD domain-containing protein [Kocuria sp. SL71]MCY1683017.1 HD domain-containing protein [Kocuria sp. SL71]
MAEIIAGITIPDSAVAREATELVRDVESDLLYHHSRRVFVFGSLRGHALGRGFDDELLYISAMFHDLGLTEKYRSDDLRFEIDAANVVRDFLTGHGYSQHDAEEAWASIALHTTPMVPLHMSPLVELVTRGVELDVMGVDYHELTDAQREEITSVHPRPRFKEGIIESFAQGLFHRPQTTFGNVKADVLADQMPGFERGNFVDEIRGSDWPE